MRGPRPLKTRSPRLKRKRRSLRKTKIPRPRKRKRRSPRKTRSLRPRKRKRKRSLAAVVAEPRQRRSDAGRTTRAAPNDPAHRVGRKRRPGVAMRRAVADTEGHRWHAPEQERRRRGVRRC